MDKRILRSIGIAGVLLALSALIGTGLMWLTDRHSQPYIADNERAVLLRSLNAVFDPSRYDNDLISDVISSDDPAISTMVPATIYRARKAGQPAGVAMTVVAPQGYGGEIQMLVGIDSSGVITGVRVVKHHETPGLGDAIEAERSDWILGFNGKSLVQPDATGWKVKKDGGQIDQFTGATITPRAVVKAVHDSLVFFNAHREVLFNLASGTELHGTGGGQHE